LHFAPDNEHLLFAAVGQGTTYTPPVAGVLDLFALTAYADGEEWDLWTIDSNGANLQRLTSVAEDLPVATWSPDGKFIAFLGGGSARTAQTGLVVMDAAGTRLQRLTSLPGHRGADWSPVP
jgi:Tol biopolymer transport system component